MKKVIIEQNEQVISVENVTDDMIIGLVANGIKSILIFDNNGLITSIELDFSLKSGWSAISKKGYIKLLMNISDTLEVFVFDSPKEIAQWLAE